MALKLGGIKPAWAALPLELVGGVIFFAHGLPKLMAPAEFAEKALGGIPIFLSYLVVAAEFGGGLLLLTGLLVRLGALSHLGVMAVAVAQVHWAAGLTGRGGFEFPLALFAVSIAILILGPDPLSIDDNVRPSLFRSRESAFSRESISISSAAVKAAGALLILVGISVALAGSYLGVPSGRVAFIISIIAGLVSVAAGAAIVAGKPWAYTPAFVVARLYLAASVLVLFWVKYAMRGLIAVAVSLAILVALSSARRKIM